MVISFSRETNILFYELILYNPYRLVSQIWKYFWILNFISIAMSTVYFHIVLNVGLICSVTFIFSSLECMYKLYFTLLTSKILLFRILLRLLMRRNWDTCSRSLQPSVLIIFFPKSTTLMLVLYSSQNCTPCVRGDITSMHCSLLNFTLILNFALLFWKVLAFELVLGISECFLCSMSALPVKIVLLDALQLLMLFSWTLIYSKKISFKQIL